MEKFDAIFKKYHHSLFIFCLKFVDAQDALDIIQDVFTIVWEKKKYTLYDEHLKAFLFQSVKNLCLNFLKHQAVRNKHRSIKKNQLLTAELDYYKGEENSLIEKENLEEIQNAIHSLSGIYREVLLLSRFEGLKNQEIADTLDIPLRTVETRLYRSLAELKKLLSEKRILILMNYHVKKRLFF